MLSYLFTYCDIVNTDCQLLNENKNILFNISQKNFQIKILYYYILPLS